MFCTALFLTFCLPLLAQKIGDLEVDLPPSKHPWHLLVDPTIANQLLLGDEDDEDSTEDEPSIELFLFTHREGEAFELLTLLQIPQEEALSPPENLPENLPEGLFGQLFPNHRFDIVVDTDPYKPHSWGFSNATDCLMHGVSRLIRGKDKNYILSYSTTASPNEQTLALWKSVLQNIPDPS